MLKTKHIFMLLFVGILSIFTLSAAVLIYSNIQTLLFKQYEQKLKTLDDALRFSLFESLNENNIKEFSIQTRIDLIIKKDESIFSSLKEYDFFLKHANESIQETEFKGKKLLYKLYKINQDDFFILLVYPRILELKNYWLGIFGIFSFCALAFFVLIGFFAKKLQQSFKKILIFLSKIDSKDEILLENSIFKELNLLNAKLYETKSALLKKQKQNKKQSDKINLKNTQLTSIISAISHELKNPLSVIELSVESLKNEHFQDKASQEKLLAKIKNQSKKLDFLTTKLNLVFNLNLSQNEKNEFDLYKLAQKIALNDGRIKLEGKSSMVVANEFLIEQVLINLISNALKYSKDEVVLSIKDKKASVKDKGIGIAKDQIKLITKKFYKVDIKSENSFGIGLFLVKKILSLHKSYLQISSELNKGSEFSFELE
ncbi:sensor histidine kinase [Campylobacter sp. MIT 97-5078]|uniref:sensor histidine kinase n=1 Tax=Campylobacter sp. MIT 97-5078 TaxID=1548153 RepID=UPI0005132FE1|nr:HAMP domain-containing sensor histidine kinase [Campylobacter sp. MIT 97-5078]KGI56984.1 ATPase [Campylobacter sp. MIT 97-5078]TQR28184.1 two-component sensor histidine kinase [Campylobacter sp. MIT 97-5078]